MTPKRKAVKPRKKKAPAKKKLTRYHHGDLRNALLDAARALLNENADDLSLRAVARRAGVSHAAPYRHFPNHETLLSELAREGFAELREEIVTACGLRGFDTDRITNIGAAYMRFVAKKPALARLMFGPQLPGRDNDAVLTEAADAIGNEIGSALEDPAVGLAVWAAVHGLAMLILENVIDLGQRRAGLAVLPSRAEILLRSLFSVQRD